ncbi:Acetylornithine aminotransferase [Acidobacteriia bacterium SbA2]|nr:Acetylornithine aminotransferase [Acidobacteriia bacterium SbA2]
MNTFEQIAERERQYLLQTYNRYPIVLTRGKGVFLWDIEEKRYLDFVSGLGVNALGHAHPRIVKAIREQAAKLVHVSNLYYHEYQGPLAEKLCVLAGSSLGNARAFFSNSGTEAIEGSIKLARLAGHRVGGAAKCRLVALEGSYHGRTFGALSLTGQDKHRKGFEPLLEDVTFVKQNDLEGLRAAVNDNTCAIVLEPIFGEGGIYECSVEFLQECRALADRHKVALIFDEIQCGLGRTGTIFAFQSFGVTPDIVAIAKPIAAGLPLGAFIAKEEFASAISPGQHGTTFGGGPLACRIALEFLAIVEEEKLLENVNKVGAYLHQELQGLVEKRAAATGVRGRGFIQGIQLEIPARPIVDAALAEGVLFNSTQDTVVRFLPPFLMEEKHIDKGIRVLKKLLGKKRKAAA